MKFLIKLTLILFVGCSTNIHRNLIEGDSTDTREDTSKVNWIENPNLSCHMNQICGLGQGKSLESAKSNARDEIAKTFFVKVDSISNFSLDYDSSTITEKQSKDIVEVTSQILEGVEIFKTKKLINDYYVLMKLNKKLSNRILSTKLNEIEKDVKVLLKQNERGSLLEAMSFYPKWKELKKRWDIINENDYSSIIFKKALSKLKVKIAKNIKIKISNKYKLLRSKLSEYGYLFNSKNYNIEVSYEKKKTMIPINVSGFQKMKLDLNLRFNYDNNISKEISKSWVIVSRNKKQFHIKVRKILKKYYENNLYQLLID